MQWKRSKRNDTWQDGDGNANIRPLATAPRVQTNKTRAFADHSDAAKYVRIDGGIEKKDERKKKKATYTGKVGHDVLRRCALPVSGFGGASSCHVIKRARKPKKKKKKSSNAKLAPCKWGAIRVQPRRKSTGCGKKRKQKL